jgi:hypothetical protein
VQYRTIEVIYIQSLVIGLLVYNFKGLFSKPVLCLKVVYTHMVMNSFTNKLWQFGLHYFCRTPTILQPPGLKASCVDPIFCWLIWAPQLGHAGPICQACNRGNLQLVRQLSRKGEALLQKCQARRCWICTSRGKNAENRHVTCVDGFPKVSP